MPFFQPAPAIPQGSAEVNLLTSADPLPASVAGWESWKTGLTWTSTVEITAESNPAGCIEFDFGDRNDDLDIPEFSPFLIDTVHGCEGKVNETRFHDEAVQALKDKSAWLIARELWTGTQTSMGFQQTATDVTPASAAGVAETADALIAAHQDATEGGRTMLHMPRAALFLLDEAVKRVGNQLQFVDGTVIVPGPGYPNVAGDWGPADGDEAAAGQVWMYATGPVQLATGEVKVTELGRGQAMRRNLYEAKAWQHVIYRYDPAGVVGALADI